MSADRDPRPLLRGYGPLACLIVAFALMAAFVPTDAPQRVTVASSGAGVTGGTAGGGGGGGSGGNNGSGGTAGSTRSTTTAGSTGTSGSDTAQPRARSSGCKGPQVTGDPYSPPCVRFSGNNGGATTRGVIGNTITIAFRNTSDTGFEHTLAQIDG